MIKQEKKPESVETMFSFLSFVYILVKQNTRNL